MAQNKFLEEQGLSRFWSHVKRLNVKRQGYIFIGDSYGTGFNTVDSTTTTTYMKMLPEKMGLQSGEYYTSAVTGAGFINGQYKNQLITLNSKITDKEFIKYIYVFGGWNDAGSDESTLKTKIDDFMTTAKQYYPNAQVILAMISQDRDFDKRYGLMKVRSVYAHYPCLSGVHNILHNPKFFDKDTYHPNQAGQNALTEGLYDAIVNGCTNQLRYEWNVKITPNSSLVKNLSFGNTTTSDIGEITILQDGDTIEGWVPETTIHFNAFNYNAGNKILIGTYDGNILMGTKTNNGLATVPIWFNYNSTQVGMGTHDSLGGTVDFKYNSSNKKVEMYVTIQSFAMSKAYNNLNAIVIPNWHFIASSTLI